MAEEKRSMTERDSAGCSIIGGGLFLCFALLTGSVFLWIAGMVLFLMGFGMFWYIARHD